MKEEGALRTISEAAAEVGVEAYVLRFWESKFRIKPLRRAGRRYYRPEEIQLLKNIHNLLHQQGYTIRGVQNLFKEGRLDSAGAFKDSSDVSNVTPIAPTVKVVGPSQGMKKKLEDIENNLQTLRSRLKEALDEAA